MVLHVFNLPSVCVCKSISASQTSAFLLWSFGITNFDHTHQFYHPYRPQISPPLLHDKYWVLQTAADVWNDNRGAEREQPILLPVKTFWVRTRRPPDWDLGQHAVCVQRDAGLWSPSACCHTTLIKVRSSVGVWRCIFPPSPPGVLLFWTRFNISWCTVCAAPPAAQLALNLHIFGDTQTCCRHRRRCFYDTSVCVCLCVCERWRWRTWCTVCAAVLGAQVLCQSYFFTAISLKNVSVPNTGP